jgi:hypothetical protein
VSLITETTDRTSSSLSLSLWINASGSGLGYGRSVLTEGMRGTDCDAKSRTLGWKIGLADREVTEEVRLETV